MKKILLSAAFVMAACCGASAQKLSYVPYTDNALMMGGCISENGRYIGGCDTEGRGFIYEQRKARLSTSYRLTLAPTKLRITTRLRFIL